MQLKGARNLEYSDGRLNISHVRCNPRAMQCHYMMWPNNLVNSLFCGVEPDDIHGGNPGRIWSSLKEGEGVPRDLDGLQPQFWWEISLMTTSS